MRLSLPLALCAGIQAARGGLTEDRAVELALRASPEIAAMNAGRRAAELAPTGASLLAAPQVRFGVTDLASEFNEPERRRNNVGLAWRPPRIGEVRWSEDMAKSRVKEAAADIAAARTKLAAEVRLLHRTVAVLDEQARLAARMADERARIHAAVSEQVAAGVANSLDREAAALALAEARTLPERYRAERRVQAAKLAFKTGVPVEELEVEASPDALRFTRPTLDRGALVARALAHRAELTAADARCEQASLAVSAARREAYPWISSMQVIRRTGDVDSPGSWGVQVAVDVPVFKWRNTGVAEAAARVEQCQLRRKALERSIAGEIDELLARMEGTAADIERARPELERAASRQVDAAGAALAAGQADLVQPMLARLRVLAIRQDGLSRLMEFRALEAGLRQAVGDE